MRPLNDERYLFMCERSPACVRVEGAAILLGWSVSQVSLLTAKGFIPILGRPRKANCAKIYSTVQLMELRQDVKLLNRCVHYLYSYNEERNRRYALARSESARHF